MTPSGILAVVHVECAKLAAQWKVRALLAVCVVGPFAFAIAMRVQSTLPSDTLFGRLVTDTGFAVPLVILGFAALWAFALLTSIVGGDLFSAEDRYGTWSTVLTRSRSRAEMFTGKVITAFGFSSAVVLVLGSSSIAAGAFVIGQQPLVNLSGVVVPPPRAFAQVSLAWASVLPPVFAFTALAVLLSVTTRSSVAGVGLPVVAALVMQLSTLLDGPDFARRLLITSAFDAWHGLLAEPPFYRPLVFGTTFSVTYIVVLLTCAYRALRRREIGG